MTATELYQLNLKISQAYLDYTYEASLLITKGNKAAGARSRAASKELGKLLKEWRKVTSSSTRSARRLISLGKQFKKWRKVTVKGDSNA